MNIKLWTLSLVLCAILLAPGAQASDENYYDRYQLHASVQSDVENDQLTVQLTAIHQAQNSSDVAQKINQDMAWALKQANQVDGIDIKTQQYNVHPNYNQKKIIGWTGRQILQLQSLDVEKVSKLLKTLQQKLQVTSMSYSPSFDARNSAIDKLISQALTAYRKRAELIVQQMGKESYRVVQLNIDSGHHRPPSPQSLRMEVAAMDSSTTAPTLVSGSSEISVTVSGSIELQ